ncbi:porin family protein [Spongorhabdus nitratireducens]
MNLIKATAVALMAIPAISFAADSGFYVSGQYGVSKADADFIDRAEDLGIDVDKEDKSYRFNLGYQINKNLALEAFYTDLGEISGQAIVNEWDEKVEMSAKGYGLQVVGFLPVNEYVSLYGKAGAIRWDVDAENKSHHPTFGDEQRSASDDGTDVAFGVGVDFNINKSFAVGLNADLYKLDDTDVSVYGASVKYKF